MRASVLDHLQAMCSTRKGAMLVRPDYGLPAVSEMVHSFPDAASALAQALAATIETYEPRLGDVRVKHVPKPDAGLAVHFEVSAVLRAEGSAVRFATTVDSSRRVTIE